MNIDVKSLRTVLGVQGLAKISDLGSSKASVVERAEIDKLSPSEKAERLFCLGAESLSQEELLAIIQKFPKVAYSASPEDDDEKPDDLDALTTAELEAKLSEEKKITDAVRAVFTGVTPQVPIIKTLAEALAFADKVKRDSLRQQLNAEAQVRNQLALKALGLELDGQKPKKDMVDVICADCGATASVPATLDLTRPVYCQNCLPKHRKAKNKPGP